MMESKKGEKEVWNYFCDRLLLTFKDLYII